MGSPVPAGWSGGARLKLSDSDPGMYHGRKRRGTMRLQREIAIERGPGDGPGQRRQPCNVHPRAVAWRSSASPTQARSPATAARRDPVDS